MQHFPPNRNVERWLDRRAARDSRPPAEVSRSSDEIDAATDWLAHIQAGRIAVK
jgi:hypothetical protein